jgi:uncharacterized protein
MRQTAISFKSKGLTLEGVLTVPQGQTGPFPAAVLCHPHPLFGGTMDNAVITAVAGALDNLDIATLRFNFRGVPPSEGKFDDGKGEQQDVRAALDIMKRWPDIDGKRLALVGYSFGAQVVLRGLGKYGAAMALVLISPPLPVFDDSPIAKSTRPKLFLIGSRDRLIGPEQLRKRVDALPPPTEFREIPEADHMWRGHEREAAQHVADFLTAVL